MKTKQVLTLLAVAMLPLHTGSAQTAPTNATSQANAPSSLSPGATEVANLAQSGVSDDVVRAFIGQSQSYYNLSAADITALKNSGVSSQTVTAMLNHDAALRSRQQTPALEPAASASLRTSPEQSDTVAAPTTPTPTSAAASGIAVLPPPAPAPQVEVIPVTPGPDYEWTPGGWSWNGSVWIWISGYWHYPTRPGHIWVGGYWSGHGRGHHWVSGHWR